jgi:uncharacterized protein (TIRG00374 family)
MTTVQSGAGGASVPSSQRRSSAAIKVLSQIIVIAIVLYATFGVLIPSFASYEDIWDAMTSVSTTALLVIVLLQLINQCGQAIVPAMLVSGMKFIWSLIADTASTVVSNLIPGPSGTATRYMVYRSYGIDAADFGRSTVANSVLNNSVLLIMPLLTLFVLAFEQHIKGGVWALAGVAAGIATAILVVTMFIMRSETTTRKLAQWAERWCNPVLRKMKKAKLQGLGDRLAGFRVDSLTILQRQWRRLLVVLNARYVLNTVMLTICMHQVGIPASVLPFGAVFTVYAFTRLLTFVQITPGGVGVTEAVYISLFSVATDGAYSDEIVGGVFLFRAATYLLPTIVGAVSFLWWRFAQRRSRRVVAV